MPYCRGIASGIACVVSSALILCVARAADWPQFRGPERSGVSKETGLLKSWPAEGPRLLWKMENLGDGHATPSVAGGFIYGMGLRGEDEVVWALDEKTGKEVWSTRIAGITYLQGRQGGLGPRATPTVDGNRLYTLGVGGDLVCLNRADGKIVWQKSLVRDFGGSVPSWGYCESPLIDGEKVIATPGGREATLVALKKDTGETVWKSRIGDPAHYASALIAETGGVRQYVQFLSGGVVGVSADDGKLLWRYDNPANRVANCSMPIYRDGQVFAASGYNTGGGLAKLQKNGDGFTAQEVYFVRDMMNHHGGMVLVGDHLYGFGNNSLICVDFKTGEVKWSNRSVGKGSVTAADGMIIARSERGPVALVEANPGEYVEKGRFDQPDRSRELSWPYPVVANGRLYLRDQGVLLCYDVSQKAAGRN